MKWRSYYDNEGDDGFNKYGFFTQGCVVGVLLDMDRGILNFYKDGNDLGTAFVSPELKEGEFYPFI